MRRALLLALALGGVALAGTPGMNHGGHVAHTPPVPLGGVAELRTLRGHAFDVAFVREMIAHHRVATLMARSELARGRDARVSAAAKGVIAAQRREITLMQAWQKRWGERVSSEGAMSMAGPGPGKSWDRWFLTGMIPHHEGAIGMARLTIMNTKTSELRKLSTAIIRDQQGEIARYRALLKVVK